MRNTRRGDVAVKPFGVESRRLPSVFFLLKRFAVFRVRLRVQPRNVSVLRIVTWLILPVVIRLSQRLSHACLSISNYTVKLRMAHYISYSLFDSIYYLDNRSNSRANTCFEDPTASADGLYLLGRNQCVL